MKKIKLLLLLLTVSATIFYSCSDSDPLENEAVASKSISLRSTLNYLKKANNIAGKNTLTTQDQALCFNFVYPITLSYNNGTQISVSNFAGLLEILASENNQLYIEGIVFPFQVQQEGVITTINNEAEFFTLLQDCANVQIVNDFVFDFTCYSIVYPIQIINANNQTVTITSQAQLMQYASATPTGNNTYQLDLVFPFSVIQNNQTIVIDDLYEFFELNNDCNPVSDCFCALVYDPVCVSTTTGVVEYSNACFAQCDGYDQNDFVDCNPVNTCSLSNLSVTVGNCSATGSYPLTINFAAANPSNTQFEIRIGNSFIGTYPLSQLPVTVTYNGSNTPTNSMTVNIVGDGVCSATTSFASPNCNSTGINFGASLGTCFNIAFPVQIQSPSGAVVTANNNGEVLQYWQPTQSTIPAFVYPITVTFSGSNPVTMVVNNKPDFESAIAFYCN